MLVRSQTKHENMGIAIIMGMVQDAGASPQEQEMWRASLSRADRHQLSDIYQSVKAQPSAIKILTAEMMKAWKREG